jgi:hypothetical protein
VDRRGEPGVASGAIVVAELLAWNHVTSSRTCVAPVEARLLSDRALAAVPGPVDPKALNGSHLKVKNQMQDWLVSS